MIRTILRSLIAGFRDRHSLVLENLALRHQVQVLSRGGKRPRIQQKDRLLWVLLSRLWGEWRDSLVMVKPETVIRWHRRGFRAYWRRKSRTKKRGRPRLRREERKLIYDMACDNPTWGAPRIQDELAMLGIEVSPTTVAKYMRRSQPPSQTWRTFLKNHAHEIVSMDFFTVPTLTCQVLYVLLLIENGSRRIVHFNVTAHPTAE